MKNCTKILALVFGVLLPGCKVFKGPQITMCSTMTLPDVVAKIPENSDLINKDADTTIQQVQKIITAIEKIADTDRDFYNTPAEMNRAWFLYQTQKNIFHAIACLHEDSAIRSSALSAYETLHTQCNKAIFNKGMYQGMQYYKNIVKDAHKKHQGVDAAVNRMIRVFKDQGVHLDLEGSVRFYDIKEQLQHLKHRFMGNISYDNRSLVVEKDELIGLPDHIMQQFSRDSDGNVVLPVEINAFCDVIETLQNEELRKEYTLLMTQQAYPQNQDVLEKIVENSFKKAELMGYDSYSDFKVQQNFLQTSSRVHSFLQKTHKTLQPLIQLKMKQLQAYAPNANLFDEKGRIPFWNEAFVKNAYRKHYFDIDQEHVREYFVLSHVLDGMFDVFGQLFSLSFEKVNHDFALWAPDVAVYKVRRVDTNDNLGYLFFDLYQREGKLINACYLPLITAVIDDCEIPCLGAGVLNLQFAKSEAGVTCLQLDEVAQLFHEFGHALQGLLGIYELSLGFGVGMSQDLQELPGYVTEFLVYQPKVLARITQHFQTGEPMPQEMAERIKNWHEWQHFFVLEKQLFLSIFSLELFGSWHKGFNIHDLYHKLHKKYRPHILIEPEYRSYLSFEHLVSYGPLYYTYVLAHVFAHNIIETLCMKGLLEPQNGKILEKAILAPLSAKDCEKKLHAFIGKKLV